MRKKAKRISNKKRRKTFDRVAGFLGHVRSHPVVASLIIVGLIVMSLASFTESLGKLSDFCVRIFKTEKQKAEEDLQKRGMEAKDIALLNNAKVGDVENVMLLLRAGVPPDSKDENDWTALHWASKRGDAHVVRALIEAHADKDPRDISKQTPLMEAAAYCHTDIVSLLIKNGVIVNNQEGATALYWAAQAGCKDTVVLLIESHADLNYRQKADWTPLMTAAREGHLEVARTLVDAGADLNASNSQGKTALILAKENGHNAILYVLLNAGAQPYR